MRSEDHGFGGVLAERVVLVRLGPLLQWKQQDLVLVGALLALCLGALLCLEVVVVDPRTYCYVLHDIYIEEERMRLLRNWTRGFDRKRR